MPKRLSAWVADRLGDLEEVTSITVIDGTLITVSRKNMSPAQIACVKFDPLEADNLRSILNRYPDVQFILNILKNARSAGATFALATETGVAFGGMGDAMRALRMDNPNKYVHRKTEYIERILSQHARVVGFERLDDSRYRLIRKGLPGITAYIGSDYEVTAEAVRLAIDRYGEFDAFVTANPNAIQISPQAATAAKHSNRRIFNWSGFMSAIHEPWN